MPNPSNQFALFCTELALKIGLEEAIFWQFLQDAWRLRPEDACQIKAHQLRQKFPFWQLRDLQRIAKSIQDQGLIKITSAPITQSNELLFMIAGATATQSKTVREPESLKVQAGANRISPHWKPDQATIDRLYQDHGISKSFCSQQVGGFVRYWLDSGKVSHSWAAQFYKQTIRDWQRQKSEVHFLQDTPEATGMGREWSPSEDALEILTRNGINKEFIQDAIAEFVLFWREKGGVTQTWNSKFIQHVKRQWAIFTATLKYDTEPRPMTSQWRPDEEVYDILEMAKIDKQFGINCIKEFILYWQENGRLQSSWNTKFLQHVKYQWASQHQLQGDSYAGQQRSAAQGSNQPVSFIDKHSDRSWADGL